jgi:DNA (cytosine-5)-methyltransferase 1
MKKKEVNTKLRVFEGFTGYGGAHHALKKAKIPCEIVGYSDIDPNACTIYEANFPGIKAFGDITQVINDEIPDFDLFTGGFPCQPFSSAGRGQGELDTRGSLFHEILRFCRHIKPKYILLENVRGFLFQRHRPTLLKIIEELEKIGYNVRYSLLNTTDYGIPQNRERVWIFATLHPLPDFWKIDPPGKKDPPPLSDYLDKQVPDKYYLTQEQIAHLEWKHGLTCITEEPLCLDIYNKKIKYDRISITITEPHHNSLRIIEPPRHGKKVVRKITPTEAFRLMGFQDGSLDFAGLADTHLYKLAANGWDINIASLILKKALGIQELKNSDFEFSLSVS